MDNNSKRNFYERLAKRPDFQVVVANQIITDDIAAVEVELWIGGAEYWKAKGISKRDIKDSKNPEIAIKLALGRAIRQLGRDVLSEAQFLVREADKASKKQQEASVAILNKRKKASKKFKKQ